MARGVEPGCRLSCPVLVAGRNSGVGSGSARVSSGCVLPAREAGHRDVDEGDARRRTDGGLDDVDTVSSADVQGDAVHVCVMMTENPTSQYVLRALGTLANSYGYTLQQSIAVMNYALNVECPNAKRLVASTLAQLNQGILGGG